MIKEIFIFTFRLHAAPPSYEQCVSGAQHIRDVGESDYVYGASTPFSPKYPVFNYPVPSKITINSIQPTCDKFDDSF